MPLLPSQRAKLKHWSSETPLKDLASAGIDRAAAFCLVNGIAIPAIHITPKSEWHVASCAYYRPDTEANRKWIKPGIHICLEKCATPCEEPSSRNWNWPGSTTDREPFGVIAHELAHHCDWLSGEKKGTYWSEYSGEVRAEANEPPITSYCDNDAEWFAEIMRLFITNHALLEQIRPKSWYAIRQRWKPISASDWREELGPNVPGRILNTLKNKGAKL